MKKQILIILIILISFTGRLFAQQKIDRFCIVEIYSHPVKSSKVIEIDYGQKNEYNRLKDSLTVTKLEAIKDRCNTNVDAVNYMSDLGWTLVQTTIIGGRSGFAFIFKKEFRKDEIDWKN